MRNQKEYVEYINLKETIDSKIEDLTKQKLEFKNQLKTIRDEIEDLLDLPFTGKNDIEANQRVGADHAIHVVLEIFDKYLKNV